MSYQVLARKWRPRKFDEIVGQEHVTRTLANAIRSGRLAHAFLFCGPRGVGKTTTARVLAKCLNCETAKNGPVVEPCNQCAACKEIDDGRSLDVLEIDGASNRGIDEIRDLRENVRYAPSSGRAKVYIIDEVHMLTKEAFNALLKTLEEPPSGVYFVFATTEYHKVPATIRSRCQRYDFRRISNAVLIETLQKICKEEKINADVAALTEIARQSEGGLRDAESLLDQAAAIGEGKVTLETVLLLLGEAEEEVLLRIADMLAAGDAVESFRALQELLDRGLDPARIVLSLTQMFRDLLVAKDVKGNLTELGLRADLVEEYRRVGAKASSEKWTALLALAGKSVADLRRSPRPRLALEVTLARMARLEDAGSLADLLARLDSLDPSDAPPSSGTTGSGTPPMQRSTPDKGIADKPRRTPDRRLAQDPDDLPEAEMRETRFAAHEESTMQQSRVAEREPSLVAEREQSRVAQQKESRLESSDDSEIEESRVRHDGPHGEVWEPLLVAMRTRKRMLASFLDHGTPVGLEEGVLWVSFDNNYYEGMVGRRENLEIIQDELGRILGRPAAFRMRPAAQGPRPVDTRAPQGTTDILASNPGLGRILQDLGGQLLPGGLGGSGS
ncbi:MAG TPA: DNA polymerase III subunit gamma/tau [bacterium]|nr:DNA polymerase III subunit gamma/tau [bacterium]